MPGIPPYPRDRARDLRRQIERLNGLPVRAATARAFLSEAVENPNDPGASPGLGSIPEHLGRVDPGWALARLCGEIDPLVVLSDHPWWPRLSGRAHAAREQLWRHAVAASLGTGRLGCSGTMVEASELARIALLHNLALWGLAVVAPERLADLWEIAEPSARRAAERAILGTDAATFGRDLAESWQAPERLADIVWLHDQVDRSWSDCVADPAALEIVQHACAWADHTPWKAGTDDPDRTRVDVIPGRGDPATRALVAEVQANCGMMLASTDATPHEERLAREHARLRRRFRAEVEVSQAREQVIQSLARARTPDLVPAESVLERAGPLSKAALAVRKASGKALERVSARLDAMTEAYRDARDSDQRQRQADRMEALAEFAAGAAHELNNPLAVILGRAQLLMVRHHDAESVKSLRAIIGQAQRAHRMLRDLIYVARPAEPRPRLCQPDAVLRAALEDLGDEAQRRGIRLQGRVGEPSTLLWARADPDALRQVADALIRNALEATPQGGTVRAMARSRPDRLDWTILDDGPGLDAKSAAHLLDPFYCGREAGRGLGLGLPRVARFLECAGGRLHWQERRGGGMTFRVTLPMVAAEARESAPGRDLIARAS